MSAGDAPKHLSDRHTGYPSHSQRKNNLHQHSQSQISRAQTHSNAYGIHFGQGNYNQHSANHPPPPSAPIAQNVQTNASQGHRLPSHNFCSESHVGSQSQPLGQGRSQQEAYGDNRPLPAYTEPPRYLGPRGEGEGNKEGKPQTEEDGLHSRRSMRLEDFRELCHTQANDLKMSREQLQRLTDDNQASVFYYLQNNV